MLRLFATGCSAECHELSDRDGNNKLSSDNLTK